MWHCVVSKKILIYFWTLSENWYHVAIMLKACIVQSIVIVFSNVAVQNTHQVECSFMGDEQHNSNPCTFQRTWHSVAPKAISYNGKLFFTILHSLTLLRIQQPIPRDQLNELQLEHCLWNIVSGYFSLFRTRCSLCNRANLLAAPSHTFSFFGFSAALKILRNRKP